MGSVAAISLVVYVTIVMVSAPVIALLFAVVALGSAALLNPLRRRVEAPGPRPLRPCSASSSSTPPPTPSSTASCTCSASQDQAASRLNDLSAATADSFARLKFIQRVLPSVYQQLLLAAIVGIVLAGRAIDVDAVQVRDGRHPGGPVAHLHPAAQLLVPDLRGDAALPRGAPRLRDREPQDAPPARRRGARARCGRSRSAASATATPPARRRSHGVDLDLAAGDWLGVIGPSGGGKTTLANLVAGLLTATDGSMQRQRPGRGRLLGPVLDGRSSGCCRRSRCSSPPPIGENIAFHRPATAEQVRAAAVRAGIDREVDALPDGFDTLVGEGRSSLSGGQRQRLALARSPARARPAA